MKRHQVMLLLMCMVLGATSASAQDKGRVGVAMGYPTTVAVIWYPTETIGVRPEVSIEGSSSEYPSSRGTTVNNTLLRTSVGVSGIFIAATHDNLRTYFSPRFTYTWTSISQSGGLIPDTDASETGYSASGSVGAQYAIGSRFSAYGEVGVEYSHQRGSLASPTYRESSVSPRTAVGVIVYF